MSDRDLEVLGFVARFGLVSRVAHARWAGTARTSTVMRESRLRAWGLVESCRVPGPSGSVVLVTRDGLKVSGWGCLRPVRFSLATVRHESAVAEVAAAVESQGERAMSEREIAVHERLEQARVFSVELAGGRYHRPDLVVFGSAGRPLAIEVELAVKGAGRLDELLRGWRRVVGEGRLGGVVYRCGPGVLEALSRAVARTRTGEFIRVEGF